MYLECKHLKPLLVKSLGRANCTWVRFSPLCTICHINTFRRLNLFWKSVYHVTYTSVTFFCSGLLDERTAFECVQRLEKFPTCFPIVRVADNTPALIRSSQASFDEVWITWNLNVTVEWSCINVTQGSRSNPLYFWTAVHWTQGLAASWPRWSARKRMLRGSSNSAGSPNVPDVKPLPPWSAMVKQCDIVKEKCCCNQFALDQVRTTREAIVGPNEGPDWAGDNTTSKWLCQGWQEKKLAKLG